jgi:uncharacterized protein (UPF0548 family)
MRSRAAGNLDDRRLTYDVPGVTLLAGDWRAGLTHGFRTYERSLQIGEGPDDWQAAALEVLRWGVKTRSGFAVIGDARATPGSRYWLIARVGPFRVEEPAEVIGVIEEPERVGMAYGTLTGHPIRGEEAFVVTRNDDDTVWFTLRSVTQPSSGVWRAASPAVLLAQRVYRRRYLRALVSPIESNGERG